MGRNNLLRRARRGQAMVEYSVVTFILAVGGLGILAFPVGTQGPLFKIFWDGLNGFYDSIYFVLQSSVP